MVHRHARGQRRDRTVTFRRPLTMPVIAPAPLSLVVPRGRVKEKTMNETPSTQLQRQSAMNDLIIQNLRARLPSTGEALLAQYARAVRDTGLRTTTEDAFAAWNRWITESAGCCPPEPGDWAGGPFRLEDWPVGGYHDKTAAAIREVSRYALACRPRG
jgi:hypothetical protein